MAVENVQFLGRGVYRLSDVSRYTQLGKRRVRSWFVQRSDRLLTPVFSSDFVIATGDRVVSFLDMIDAWIAGQLRAEGVSMPTVRKAHSALKIELKTQHPFAHSSIYTDGKRVFTDAAQYVNDPTLTEVVTRQTFFPRVRQSLKPIEYSPESNLAARWNISESVVIDPCVCFGQPVVKGTGVSTFVLYQSCVANDRRYDLVAELFGVSQTEVGDAVAFEEEHGRQRAA